MKTLILLQKNLKELEVIKNKLDLIKDATAPIDDDSNFAKHLNAPDIIVERSKVIGLLILTRKLFQR